ncbi:perilipin-2-like isoform X2 [Ptychodera flava]|uniref:perilipin-2-like isoform X2 n=2 Tax=Ptychodera flava TaxID=63121 RepID=UPI00396A027B
MSGEYIESKPQTQKAVEITKTDNDMRNSATKKQNQVSKTSTTLAKVEYSKQEPIRRQKKRGRRNGRTNEGRALHSQLLDTEEQEIDEFFIDDNIPSFPGDGDNSSLHLCGNLSFEMAEDHCFVSEEDNYGQLSTTDVDVTCLEVQSTRLVDQSTMTDCQGECNCVRKSLSEANNQNDMDVEKEVTDVAIVVPEARENIIIRVAGLPVVNTAIGQVSNMYTKTKEYNGLLKYTFEVAEKSVGTVASTAKPVVDKFEKQISYANDFACNQMDKLEEACPVISMPPEKIYSSVIDSGKRVWDGTKAVGSQTMETVANTRVGQAVCAGVNTSLALSEMVVDHCLPPDEKEQEEKMEPEATEKADLEKEETSLSTVNRVISLSGKVRQRVYKRAMTRLQNAQHRSQETLEKLHYTVDLIAYAKTHIDSTNQKVKDQVSGAQEKLWNTWNDWTTEEEEETSSGEEEVETSENKTVAIAHNLAKRLKVGCGKVVNTGVQVLPENVVAQAAKAKTMADELYESLRSATVLNDMSATILDRAQERLSQVSEAMVSLTEYIANSSAVQWMVPDIELDQINFEDYEDDYDDEDSIDGNDSTNSGIDIDFFDNDDS